MSVTMKLLAAAANGAVSTEDVAETVAFQSVFGFDKNASKPLEKIALTLKPNEATQQAILQGLYLSGALAVGAAAAHGGERAIKHIVEKHEAKKDLATILEVHPKIKEQYKPEEIALAYSSIRKMNPEMAGDPLVGGGLLQQVLRNRDPFEPTAAPRVDADLAANMLRLRPEDRHLGAQAATDIIHAGMQQGFRAANENRTLALKERETAAKELESQARIQDNLMRAPVPSYVQRAAEDAAQEAFISAGAAGKTRIEQENAGAAAGAKRMRELREILHNSGRP